MSTRAIIGYKNPDSSITGLWQWNDGAGLLPLLRENFNTFDKVKALVSLGMISCLCTSKEAHELDVWMKSLDIDNGRWIAFDNTKAYQDSHHIGRETKVYKDMADACGQDINFLYLFAPDENTWEVYT